MNVKELNMVYEIITSDGKKNFAAGTMSITDLSRGFLRNTIKFLEFDNEVIVDVTPRISCDHKIIYEHDVCVKPCEQIFFVGHIIKISERKDLLKWLH